MCECYKCGCVYIDRNQEDHVVISQYICKRCKKELKEDVKTLIIEDMMLI